MTMQNKRKNYKCTIDEEVADGRHSPDGSIFLREMTSWPPCWKLWRHVRNL